MTNEEYRKQRGTDHRFRTTKKQAKKVWYETNKEAILARRKRDKVLKNMNPSLDDEDDQEDDL